MPAIGTKYKKAVKQAVFNCIEIFYNLKAGAYTVIVFH